MEPMKLETLQERAHNVILANPGITPDQRIKLLDIAFDKYRNSSATTPHRWEPDFSEGEPALDSKICGVCGKEHEESATNVRELAAPHSSECIKPDHYRGGADCDAVGELLEQWKYVWAGDRNKYEAKYPAWLVRAAEELFAHDMCDAWNWDEYVKAACVIIERHRVAALIEASSLKGLTVMNNNPKVLLADMVEGLSMALDLLDMYDQKLIELGEAEAEVNCPIHLNGKAKARATLERAERTLIEASSLGKVTAEMVSLLQDIKNRYGSGLCNCHDVTTDNPTCLSTRVSTAIESLAAQSSSLVTKEKS